MRIRFTPTARTQFLSGISYIQRDNPCEAKRFRAKAKQALRRLIDFPESGRIIHEFPDLPQRELVATSYRFFYRVKSKTIWIVAVWHGAQLPLKPIRNEDG